MKFIFKQKDKKICAFIVILLFFGLSTVNSLSNQFETKNKIKSNGKNSQDFLHYMAKFNHQEQESEEDVNSNTELSNKFKFKSKLRTKTRIVNDPRKTFKYNVTSTEILQDWFIIASDEFQNIKRFPPVKLPNGETEVIRTNALNYRLNSAMNCTDPAKPTDERLFYFRLTNNSLYYSATKTDLNVLGYIKIKDIGDIIGNVDISGIKEYFCFNTKDELYKEWKICNESKEVTEKWYCVIKKYLKLAEEEDICWGIPRDPDTHYTEKIIKKPIILVPLPSPICNENWDFSRNGDDWVCDCKDGSEQSPIDLPRLTDAIESPIKPIFNYYDVEAINQESSLEGVIQARQKLNLFNTDNMLHIMHYDMGKVTTVNGAVYQAQEITFHSPSNHQIKGKQFDLEISIIHFGITKGDIGKQLVLSFVFESKPGVYNMFLEDLDVFNLPNPVLKKRALQKNLYIPKILYEENDEVTQIPIMKPFSFYTYSGSLPFPPCTERTINYVASKPLRLSSTTITLFKEALRMPDLKSKTGEIFSSNNLATSNRNVQPLNGRPVYWYDHVKHCGPDPSPKPKKPSGHYEKIMQKGVQYFYVGGPDPSGLPGAFVVSEKEAKGVGHEQA